MQGSHVCHHSPYPCITATACIGLDVTSCFFLKLKAIYLTTFENREHRKEAEEISLLAKMTTEARMRPPA